MTFKEKVKIIIRSAKLIEKADKGAFRISMINQLPGVIQTFSGIFLASLVIDGVTGGKPVSYLITAAAIFQVRLNTGRLTNQSFCLF